MLHRFKSTNKVDISKLKDSKSRKQNNLQLVKVIHQKNKTSLKQTFDNIPITKKHLIGLITCELLSVLGIGVVGIFIIHESLQTQLLEQAKSELIVADVHYNTKINQISSKFREKAANPTIINAAIAHNSYGTLNSTLKDEVKKILVNENHNDRIEYATLVGKDLKIIVNVNTDREGEVFNPDNLVSEAINNQRQIKANSIISWSELRKESPELQNGFKNKDALIRYTVTPVKDEQTQTVVGALVSGDIVNGKGAIVQETLKALGGGYSAIYLRKATGEFSLATSLSQGKSQSLSQATYNIALPKEGISLLNAAAKNPSKTVTNSLVVGKKTYAVAAKAIPNTVSSDKQPGNSPVAILVQGIPEKTLDNLLQHSLQKQSLAIFIGLLLILIWTLILEWGIIKPIKNLQQTAKDFTAGEKFSRSRIFSHDEIGQLATIFNSMADSMTEQAEFQRGREKICSDEQQYQTMQTQLLQLLENIESAARGDLTVRADVTIGEIGTVADFFNAIVESLRGIVTKVKESALQVNQAIGSNEGAIRHLAEEALTQAVEIHRTLDAVDNMTQSIQAVAVSAQQAAKVAHNAAHTAKKSGIAMDLTVQNILHLRETVGDTARKVKRLGESTQHISRVIALINQISTQTNLLAINASLEASRAGEEYQGFVIVAEEVGELAAQSVAATREIEQIVENIQRETTEVVQAMELGTVQVTEGTHIVEDAKQNLTQILEISRQIDLLVQSISQATTSQVATSQAVSHLMREIASSSQHTSYSSRQVSESLVQTLQIAEELQQAVGTFQVN